MHEPVFVTWRQEDEADHVARHGVPFETAARVFRDPTRCETAARTGRYGDTRLKVVGLVDGLYLAVICALDGDVTHLLSARRANKREFR